MSPCSWMTPGIGAMAWRSTATIFTSLFSPSVPLEITIDNPLTFVFWVQGRERGEERLTEDKKWRRDRNKQRQRVWVWDKANIEGSRSECYISSMLYSQDIPITNLVFQLPLWSVTHDTDIRPTSPSSDPITPAVQLGNHYSASLYAIQHRYDMATIWTQGLSHQVNILITCPSRWSGAQL